MKPIFSGRWCVACGSRHGGRIAGALWPGETGAENLIQVCVAEAIYRQRGGTKPAIHLEPTLGRIDADQFPGDTRRVDIGLLRRGTVGKQETYFSVVEIKKHPGRYDQDVVKICEILSRVQSVRYAYLVTYFQKYDPHHNLKRALHDQIDATERAIAESVRACGHDCRSLKPSTLDVVDDAEGRWRAAVLVTRFARAV